MLDPFSDSPDDPRWAQFLDEANALALAHGARPSLSQTKRVAPGTAGSATLDPRCTRERFLTPYFRQFLLQQP